MARIDWARVAGDLERAGWSRLPRLLAPAECRSLVRAYDDEALFRSTVDMERHRFGRGQYRYFAYPLPPVVSALRRGCYARLSPLANEWSARLGRADDYPADLDGFLARCHAAGQRRPTPLLLRYGPGDYNCLHQDLYGELAFPFQVVVPLSRRGQDYEGGEVIFLEQRPRAQSQATAVTVERGEGLVFTNRHRPVRGARGFYAMQMRHGVSEVTRGGRVALGIIFHDAA